MKPAWKQMLTAFVLGLLVGTVGGWYGLQHHWRHLRDPGTFYSRMLDQFTRQLQLTPEQRTQVAKLLDDKRQHVDALRAQVRPQFEAIRNESKTQIRALLTPGQRRKFDVLQAAWEARWDHWRQPPRR